MKNDIFGRKDNMFLIVCFYYVIVFDSRSYFIDLYIDVLLVILYIVVLINNEEVIFDIILKCI